MPRRPKTTSRYPVAVRIAALRAERTSQPYGRRPLLSLLSSDSLTSHVTRHLPNVSPPYGAGPVATGIPTITTGHSLLSARQFNPPPACLAVSLPKGLRHRVPIFRLVDLLDDLGAPRTPVVQQFRTRTLETCNLITPLHTKERVLDLLIFIGLAALTTLQAFTYIHLITRP